MGQQKSHPHPATDSTLNQNSPFPLPLSKISPDLEQQSPSIPYSFLFYNGTFCPFHKGHLDLLQHSAEHLSKLKDYKFVHGFVSPCHSSYAFRKLRQNRINSKHRLEMMKYVVDPMKNWDIDLQEMYAEEEMSIWETLTLFVQRIRNQIFFDNKDKKFIVFWLAGSDGGSYIPEDLAKLGIKRMVVCNRQDQFSSQEEQDEFFIQCNPNAEIVHSPNNFTVSSTKIREICSSSSQDKLAQLKEEIGIQCIADYIIENSL